MSQAGFALERSPALAVTRRRHATRRTLTAAALWAVLAGNAAAIVYLCVHGGNVSEHLSTGELLTSLARITGLLAAFAALIQMLLLARLPWLERLVGFDRLSVWHRWNGHATLDLVLAHVVLSIWGYSLMDKVSLPKEISTMLGGGIYPGMITATVGTFLLIAVVVSSVVIVRRRLRYETWYAVHFAAYAGIALAWFHQIPTGNELVLDHAAADYWRALYLVTLGLLLWFRVLVPLAKALRHRLRVGDVVVVYRVVSEDDIIFRDELEELARERGIRLLIVVGDHRTREGRRLLSPRHLRELVPDIAERQVYVCGPPAMAEALERNVRRADVPAAFIHTEKFAL